MAIIGYGAVVGKENDIFAKLYCGRQSQAQAVQEHIKREVRFP